MRKKWLLKISRRTTAVVLAAVMAVSGAAVAVPPVVESAETGISDLTGLSDFEMADVKVTDEYYVNALDKELDYLIKLDEKKLLAGFKETASYAAGMSSADRTAYMDGATRYSGGQSNWENSLIGGHTLGHYMSAVAQAVTNPGSDEEKKAELQKKLDTIVSTLKDCQAKTANASVCKKGYIFGAVLKNISNLELQFDNVEANRTNIGSEAWVPWYTMHKILAGLVDIYKLTGNEDALAVAEGLGEWTYNRVSQWNESTRKTVLAIEYGGMNDALYELAKCTKNETLQGHFIAAGKIFDEDIAVVGSAKSLFQKVYDGDANCLNNQHANTTIPKFLGALNRYATLSELNKLEKTDEIYLDYAKRFWDMVVYKHSYVTGGSSEWEHFGLDNVLNKERTRANNETCNTYNMLKLSRGLFKITGDKKYADYYEKVLINAIVASQNPETGMSMYWQPMATGYFKVYSTETEDFWCCTGSGMENFTKLNDSIYFYKGNNVVVNQYRSSELTWTDKNLKLVQEADLLTGTKQTFTIKAIEGSPSNDSNASIRSKSSVNVNILFRIPDYAAGEVSIQVDGKDYPYTKVGEYAEVKGTFDQDTKITVDIPMAVTAENLPDAENTYSFKYGPFVLCAQLGTEHTTRGEDTVTEGVSVDVPAVKIVDSENIIVDYKIGNLEEYIENVDDNFEKVLDDKGNLSFKMKNTDQQLTFVPYYSEHTNRYGIYWNFLTDEAGIENAKVLDEKKKAKESKYLGVVQAGYGQNEVDELHDLKDTDDAGNSTSESQTADGSSRWAKAGGYFSYRMVASKTVDTSLICQFDKKDNGKTIKISVGGQEIANETLEYSGKDGRYQKTFVIPKELVVENGEEYTDGSGNKYTVVRIKFESAKAGEISAALYDEAYTYQLLGTVAEMKDITASEGTVSKEDGTYKVQIPAGAKSTDLTFTLTDPAGYVTLNGNAIFDGKPKAFTLDSSRIVTYDLRVYAEDFVTYTDYKLTVVKDYEKDETVQYFVDCGDYNVTTVSEGDKLGTHNSVTDQALGKDPVTGYTWGIVDTISDPLKNGSSETTEDAAYTDNTWPFETDSTVSDGVDKTRTNRYTKNQFENGIAERYLDYEFELENGTYEIEVGFSNPWNCSTNPNLYANREKQDEVVLAQKIGVPANGHKVITGTVTVTDGKLTINARSDANDSTTLAINMTYIKIFQKPKEDQKDDNGVNNNQQNGNQQNNNQQTNNQQNVSDTVVAASVSVKAAGYTLAGNKITLKKGKSVKLVSTVSPAKASQKVTYTSSKKKVATVSSAGTVKAKKAGTAKITVKTANGKKKVITIKVVKKEKVNKKLTLSKKKLTLKKGKTTQIKVKKMTAGTTSKLTYKSGKKSIASVDKYGVIKAKKKGKATITVTCGKKKATIKVTVK